jgi:hypothetical protein
MTPAHAGNADAVLTLTASPIDPADGKPRASLSRDAIATEPAANFRAAYTVSIFNPSNSSKNFRFVGNVNVPAGDTGSAAPTQFVSSRSDCSLTSTAPVQIVCPKIEVAKGRTVVFSFQFRTPTAGKSMDLLANLFFPASNGTLTASGTSSIELVKLLYSDYTLGFNTLVPTTGGTFFSGNASNLAGSPGGVATTGDPFTTTIIVPRIPAPTSATVVELQNGELSGCTGIFINAGCFQSNLTIPSAPGALPGLVIYLRIDRTRHIVDRAVSINSARIGYSKGTEAPVEVPTCSATVVPAPGKPCIRARKEYPGTADVPVDWQFDWEFQIDAVDNGRYVNL